MRAGLVSVASGVVSTASGACSVASGAVSVAYGDGQVVDASAYSQFQHSLTLASAATTDATPTALNNANAKACLIRFVDQSGAPDWTKSARVRLTVVARQTDTPGTSAVWTAEGGIEGDGSSAYTWMGGSAPAFTAAAYNDVGAALWAVTVAIGTDPLPSSAAALIGTVTGAAATAISWECTLELDEVSG